MCSGPTLRDFPEDACLIESSLQFREATLRMFERLVLEGLPVTDTPESEEVESSYPQAHSLVLFLL